MSMISRHERRKILTGMGGLAFAACVIAASVRPGWAQTTSASACSQYSTFTALGEGEGVQTVHSAPGASLADSVDGELPGAQAEVDSLAGSRGWAGAPYSSIVAGNVGAANLSPNQFPVFAVSTYPATPTAQNSTTVATERASSNERSSEAKVTTAAPSSSTGTGQVTVSASAACGENGTVHSVAQTSVNAFEVAGVLEIGAVTSHAEASAPPAGTATLTASTSVLGVTVLGQPAAITDQGLVIPGSKVPVAQNPLAQELVNAGIGVAYLAPVKDPRSGSVMAAGIEISVTTHATQGVGTGVATATYTLGRAYAVANHAGGSSPAMGVAGPSAPTPGLLPDSSKPSTDSPGPAVGGGDGASPSAASLPGTSSSGNTVPVSGTGRGAVTGRRMASAALLVGDGWATTLYPALAGGTLFILATFMAFGMRGTKIRWR